MTDGLQKLFGSHARVKLLRLFLFNPRSSFTHSDVIVRARVSGVEGRRELGLLSRTGVIARVPRGKGIRYALNSDFEYIAALQNLLLNAPARGKDIVERIRGAGLLKLVVLSGMFMGDWDTQLDIFIVGDKVKERKLREYVRQLEAEIGKEMRYVLLSSEDFFLRLNMNDKLIRDMLDYPHKIVLDKFNIGLK